MRRHPILWLCILALLLSACVALVGCWTDPTEPKTTPAIARSHIEDPIGATPTPTAAPPTATPTPPIVQPPQPLPCTPSPFTDCGQVSPWPTPAPGSTPIPGNFPTPPPGTYWPTLAPTPE
jgi:endoglucanase